MKSKGFLASFLFCFCLIFTNCKNVNSDNDYPELSGHILKIEKSAGSLISFEGLETTIPSFFNFGYFSKSLPTFLIAKDLNVGDKVEIFELGALEFEMENKLISILIASPTSEDYKILNVSNYNEFSLAYPQLKNLFEIWIKTNCTENSCNNIKWKNDLKAKLLVQQALTK